jgi:hypothetical protein
MSRHFNDVNITNNLNFGVTDTFTIYKNGVATPLSVSITEGNTTSQRNDVSVGFLPNDKIALRFTSSGSTALNDPVINASIY